MAAEIVVERNGSNIVSGGEVDFGDYFAGQTSHAKVEVSNTGDVALTITSVALTTGTDYSIVTTLPGSIGAGESTFLVLSYTPSAAGATDTDTVTIENSDADEGTFTIDLTGDGLAAVTGATAKAFDTLDGLVPNLSYQLGSTVYLALLDNVGDEISGTGYARQAILPDRWDVVDGVAINNSPVNFGSIVADWDDEIFGVALYSAATNGNLLFKDLSLYIDRSLLADGALTVDTGVLRVKGV